MLLHLGLVGVAGWEVEEEVMVGVEDWEVGEMMLPPRDLVGEGD
jgi:hypothetical protein